MFVNKIFYNAIISCQTTLVSNLRWMTYWGIPSDISSPTYAQTLNVRSLHHDCMNLKKKYGYDEHVIDFFGGFDNILCFPIHFATRVCSDEEEIEDSSFMVRGVPSSPIIRIRMRRSEAEVIVMRFTAFVPREAFIGHERAAHWKDKDIAWRDFIVFKKQKKGAWYISLGYGAGDRRVHFTTPQARSAIIERFGMTDEETYPNYATVPDRCSLQKIVFSNNIQRLLTTGRTELFTNDDLRPGGLPPPACIRGSTDRNASEKPPGRMFQNLPIFVGFLSLEEIQKKMKEVPIPEAERSPTDNPKVWVFDS